MAPSDRLTADISTGYVQGSTRFAQAYTGYDVWAQFVFGNPNGLNAPTRGYLRATPEALRDLESTRDNSRFTGSLTLRHNPVSWLNPRLVVGLDQSDETNAILFPRNPAGSNYFFGALSLGDKTVERPRVGYNTLDYGATASFQPAGDIGLKTSAGAQFYHKRTETTIATGRTFPTPAITTISGAAVRSSEEFFVENKSFGVYLQQEVAFRDRVFVTGAAAQEARPTTLAGRSTMYAPHAALATSQPLATAAGMEILSRGGNAFDAAVAAAAVLNVVEPHMTGIGGDMFALVWSAREKKLVAMNALGRAGSGMTREELLRRGHDRVPGKGAEAITVPGAVSGWAALLERYGKLSLAEVLQPAIRIAEEGFPVSPIIARQWRALEDDLREDPGAAATFLVDGKAPAAGQWFRNPDLARSFRAIAEQGPAAMYGGDLGRRLVEGVRERGGFLTPEDMARHRVEWVTPVSAPFRGYRLWEMPPPNQGVAALQMMRILDAYDLKAMGHNSPEYLHHLIEAKKLAYADLDGHVGDPDHMRVSVDDLVSEEYIRGRRALLSPDTAAERVDPGRARTETETVYLAAADAEGNMVSFINSVFGYFGSGVVVPGTGIVLQNRGAGFTLEEGHPNTVAPGKRPFHTLVPAFVTRTTPRGEEPWLAFGVMGGSMQPQGHAQVLLNLLVFDMDLQEAIDAARFRHLSGKRVVLEAPVGDEVRARLRAMGHEVLEQPSDYGGAQAVMRLSRGWAAASDPRKDGHAAGR